MELYKNIWEKILSNISKKVSTISYDMWFDKLEPVEIVNGKIIVSTQLKSTKECLSDKKFVNVILESIKELNNENVSDYQIITSDEISSYKSKNTEDKPEKVEVQKFKGNMSFNENFTFDTFVVGESNRIAQAAAKSVAENPGVLFNPLLIWGGVGLGKTHLLHAIANYLLDLKPNLDIIYTTAEQFTNDFISSIYNNKDNKESFKFREKYRNVDVLMLDDIQFFAGKITTQEALFHTFNDLQQSKKQIILTTDRNPKELTFIEERLQSRFNAGLKVEINSPDIETRIAIIRKKAFQKNFILSNEVVNFIAENIDSNIREIEGAISKLIFFCHLNNSDRADNLDLVKEALKNDIDITTNVVSLDSITDCVCKYFKITKQDILSNKRPKNISTPRQIAIYLMLDMLDVTTTAVGNYFGGKDHTTISYAREKINSEIEKQSIIKTQVKDIKNIIQRT